MFEFLDYIGKVYCLIVPILVIFLYIAIALVNKKEKTEKQVVEDNKHNNTMNKKWVFDIVSYLLLLILYIVCAFVVKNKTVIIVALIILFIQRIYEIAISLDVFVNAIHKETKGNLTLKELFAIGVLGIASCYIFIGNIANKLIIIVTTINNKLVSDLLVVVILGLIVTISTFLLLLITALFLKYAISLISKFCFRDYIKFDFEHVIIKAIKRVEVNKFYSISINCKNLKMISIIIKPCLFVVDIINNTLSIMFLIVLDILLYLVTVIKWILKIIKALGLKLISESDRIILLYLFRSVLVFSLTTIVALNRYCRILKLYNSGTAVLEFIVSVIVIPLVLSWVLELNNYTKKKCS